MTSAFVLLLLASSPATGTSSVALGRIAVTYREQPVFYVADDDTRKAKERSKRLSSALATAVEATARADLDAPNAAVDFVGTSTVIVKVRGHIVGELYARDARAAGQPDLQAYAGSLEDGLGLFVADQRRKAALQGSAIRVVLAIVIIVIGLLLLRLSRYGFRRADEYLDDRTDTGTLRPISLLGVPIIGPEALSAAAALAIAVGRIASYVGIIFVSLSLALSQFELTRPWVGAVVGWASPLLFAGFEQLVLALPRLVLAAILLVVGSGALRVARVLFDDEAGHRPAWEALTPSRARVLRIVASIAVIMVIAPLAVAAVFGRFHTPLELLIVAASVSGALALAPLLASGAVGLMTIWRGQLVIGDVISVRGVRGTITAITTWDVEIETDRGARTSLPMLSLLAAHVVREQLGAASIVRVIAPRRGSVRETIEAIRALVPDASVSCVRFDASEVELRVEPAARDADTNEILLALSDAEIVSASIEKG
jgi:small-conductance mechanosensitive channel